MAGWRQMHLRQGWLSRIASAGKGAMLLAALVSTGCPLSLDSAMWECQLQEQKENAGRSEEAIAERNRSIEECMRENGYRLNLQNRSCKPGALVSSCYQRR